MTHPLLTKVRHTIRALGVFQPGSRVVVAVSGGADSLVLLHLLHQLQNPLAIQLHVATLDHQIRGEESASDAEFVRAYSESLGVLVTVGRVDVPAYAHQNALSIEVAARTLRYQFLIETARTFSASFIMTAHHRDDQAETVLMHLLRGTGLAGLRGIAPCSELAPGITLVRPLLTVSRAEIDSYALDQQLTPRVDSTNSDPAYFRNRLRLETLPYLRTLSPAIDHHLVQLAQTAAADYDALLTLLPPDPVGRDVYQKLLLSIQRLVIMNNPVQREGLTFDEVERARHFILKGHSGDSLKLINDVWITLTFTDIRFDTHPLNIAVDSPRLAADTEIRLTPGEAYPLADGWIVEVGEKRGHLAVRYPLGASLMLRTRRRGDRFKPAGLGGHSQRLSDTLSNLKIPLSYRDELPLVIADGEIVGFVALTESGCVAREGVGAESWAGWVSFFKNA